MAIAIFASVKGDVHLGPASATILFLVLIAGAVCMAYQGSIFRKRSGSIADPAVAAAIIVKQFTTGNPLWGACYLTVSFTDAAGIPREATFGLMRKAWQYLRVGRNISITYSQSNPAQARIGGAGMQSLYDLAGLVFLSIGTSLAILFLSMLIGGWTGWMDLQPFHR